MYDLYEPLVLHPNPDAVIRVENAAGPILLISSKMDTNVAVRACGKADYEPA